ncbi:MAG: DUF4982 domain-containing protein [Treponema sp.]|jgi:hypothetical protein|nr:DUF4982 domain-containing protein [Treponema sp.]
MIPLSDWRFSFDTAALRDAPLEPWQRNFDDSEWQQVVVPHDWAVTLPFSRECSSGTGYLPGGTAWYRTAFAVDALEDGGQVILAFDGVYKNSQVWCNGHYLGLRPSGFSPFSYDITRCVRTDGPNVLAVKVTHEDIADSRWFTGSGIQRAVTVRVRPALRIVRDTVVIGSSCAGFSLKGQVENHGVSAAGQLRVSITLEDDKGRACAFETRPFSVAAGGQAAFTAECPVAEPRLWSPETPALYRITLGLAGEGSPPGTPLAGEVFVSGLREARFDPDEGFFLNGKNLKLKGVCCHDDAGCLGSAMWKEVWRRRLEKLKAAGCNAFRMSHNPHADALYDLCDELGFLVMDEAFDEWEGCKNKWSRGHNVYPPVHQGYSEHFGEWAARDIAAMVTRGRNHPSVVMWSIGNEIDYPNDPYCHPSFQEMTGNNDANKPAVERQYSADKPNMERLAGIAAFLAAEVRKSDQSRPVLSAAAFPELSSKLGFFDKMDIIGYNYKEQCYDDDHGRFPRLPILGSENNHSLAAWRAVTERPFIAGQFLWTGCDFLGEAQGWPVRGSRSGLLDLAGFEKTAWYRRKALWQDAPYVALAACLAEDAPPEALEPRSLFRTWAYPTGADTLVFCYTNAARVELFLNGASLGTRERGPDVEYLFWKVPFAEGRLEARAEGARDIGAWDAGAWDAGAWDALETNGAAVALGLRVWRPDTLPSPLFADTPRYRMAQVEVEALDAAGRLCPQAAFDVAFEVTGNGVLAGLENGDLTDCTEYPRHSRRLHRGRLIAYVRVDEAAARSGAPPAVLRATSCGIAGAETRV